MVIWEERTEESTIPSETLRVIDSLMADGIELERQFN